MPEEEQKEEVPVAAAPSPPPVASKGPSAFKKPNFMMNKGPAKPSGSPTRTDDTKPEEASAPPAEGVAAPSFTQKYGLKASTDQPATNASIPNMNASQN